MLSCNLPEKMEICVPLQMTLRPFIIINHQYQDVGLLLLPAVIWIVRGERQAMLQHGLNWHRCEQRCSQIEDWTLALWEMLFSQQLILSIKCLQSYFKPYISAPQMKLKQFYNGAESQTPLRFIAVEGYCALLVYSGMPTHPNPSPKHVYMCMCLPFFLK